jgi:ribonuclease D
LQAPSGTALEILDDRRSAEEVTAVLDSLTGHLTLAFDTESDAFHAYDEQVCLVQMSAPGLDILLDPLAHGLPGSLRRLIEDPARTWVLHGADFDVLLLRRRHQVGFGRLFDTMIAARLLGDRAPGLASLAERRLGVSISKTQQRSDWGRRPLSAAQLRYAREDTVHLLALREGLIADLEAAGRLAWLEEECEQLRQRVPAEREVDPDAWLKIKGVRELDEPGRRAVRGAFSWRETEARRRNRAPFRVLGNDAILGVGRLVAAEGAAGLARLGRVKGMPGRIDLGGLRRSIESELASELPLPDRRRSGRRDSGAPLGDAARGRLERLREVRARVATELDLDPGMLFPTAAMEAIAREPPADGTALADVGGLGRWRAEVLGRQVLDVL